MLTNNDNVKAFLQQFFDKNIDEVDCSSLRNILISLDSDAVVVEYSTYCKEYVEKQASTSHTNRRFKKFAGKFVNNSGSHFFTERPFATHQERVQRAIILEYYNPGFLDEILLPFIDWNREADLKRAKTTLYKTRLLYQNDTDQETAKKVLEKEEEKFMDVKYIYEQDWATHFHTIKTIIAEVKNNELNSIPSVTP